METRIAVVGAGYVGLVMAACFAKKYEVLCVDVDEGKVDAINEGKAPFFEPGLDELLQEVHRAGSLVATTDAAQAVLGADFVFISVGTPSTHTGAPDLSFVRAAAHAVGKALAEKDGYTVVVQRSTVIPGSTRGVVLEAIQRASGKTCGEGFGIAFVPEFLREGNAVTDFLNPDRIVIGTEDERVRKKLLALYTDFYENLPPSKILLMSVESAELVKYASNAFLATKISFANEIALLAELVDGVDVVDVMRGVGLDHRINPHFFGAGAGFGGSCFPKDLRALIHFARTHAVDPLVLEATFKRNEAQACHIVDLAEDALGGLGGKRVALLGLAFKPNTSDMREAPSLRIISELIERGVGEIVGCDPRALEEARRILGDRIEYAAKPEDALRGADCAIVVTEWAEFARLKPQDFIRLMRNPVVIDGRRLYPPSEFEGKLVYIAVGRGRSQGSKRAVTP